MRPRTCPNCRVEIPLEEGFHFDENLNLICDYCGKTAFLIEKEEIKQDFTSNPIYKKTILPIQPMDDFHSLNLDKL